jgi:RNA polymerase sigma-70 factor (ECF subfamily)
MKVDDRDLVLKASAGDSDAFGQLYDLYMVKIYNYVFYRVHSQMDAEDITAKVFIRALKNIHRYEDRGYPFSAWLYRIAHNLVANWYRDMGKQPLLSIDEYQEKDLSVFVNPEKAIARTDEEEKLLYFIGSLPEERQQLIILKFVDGLSNTEIGQIMNRTEGAIKSLYHRTLVSLRKTIRETDPEFYQLMETLDVE